MSVKITEDMRAVVEAAHLCFAATVGPDSRPNLSPKGTVRVLDDTHVYFLDIASPGTRANLHANPWMELNVVDQLSRRGYRFLGQAQVLREGPVYEAATERVFEEEGHEYPVHAVVLLSVERAGALVSPGYTHVDSETAMRDLWRVRRAELDRDFEEYLSSRE